MSRRTIAIFVITLIVIVLWALHFLPAAHIPPDLSDFLGGAAVGLVIGSFFAWMAER